jgi:CheY-like chemotaxis protein
MDWKSDPERTKEHAEEHTSSVAETITPALRGANVPQGRVGPLSGVYRLGMRHCRSREIAIRMPKIARCIRWTSRLQSWTPSRGTRCAGQSAMPPSPERKSSGMRRSPGRVLIIDDDVMVARSVERVLSTAHSVTVVHSAVEGLARIAEGARFDVILCDVMMPSMSGIELHERLRAVAPSEADRLVFVTGCALLPEVRAFLDAVSNTCLEKPFDVDALREFVERRVRDAHSQESDKSQAG